MHSCNEGDIDVSTRVWAAPGDVGSVVIHEYYFIFLIKKKKVFQLFKLNFYLRRRELSKGWAPETDRRRNLNWATIMRWKNK